MASGEERSEAPTPKKLKEARKEGRVARTQDLGAWLGMMVCTVLIPIVIRSGTERMRRLVVRVGSIIENPDPAAAMAMMAQGLRDFVIVSAPLVLGLLLVGVATTAAQGGVHIATKNFKPQFKRLNPMAGFKRAFGPQGMWEGAKTLIKSTIVGLLVWRALVGSVPVLAASGSLPLGELLRIVGNTVVTLMRTAAGAGLVMAIFDYAVMYRRTRKGLKMTKTDVKQENKQSEGDPQLKSAIRSRQIAISRNRMMADIVSADVVLVNPTHVAVALRYDPAKGAPRVVAKGSGHVAARIRAAAVKYRVPMVADPPLARALNATCNIGQEIPPETFTAVARVLAFVLGLKARGSAAGLHRPAFARG